MEGIAEVWAASRAGAARRGPQVISARARDSHAEQALAVAAQYAAGTPPGRSLPVYGWGGRIFGHLTATGRGEVYLTRGEHRALLSQECAITETDHIIAGKMAGQYRRINFNKIASSNMVAANMYDLWAVAGGHPLGAYAGAAFTAIAFDDTSTGAIPHGGNVSSYTKVLTWLALYTVSATNTGMVMLTDRAGTYEACTFPNNSTQNMTNGTAFGRYVASSDPGLIVSVTGQTLTGSTSANLSALTYVNVAGATQTMPTTGSLAIINALAAPTSTLGARVGFPATASSSTTTLAYFVPLAAGDYGIKSITSYKTSVNNTGTLCFVCHYPLGFWPIIGQAQPIDADHVAPPTGLEQIRDGACLSFFALSNGASGMSFAGEMQTVWN